jgi:hypothetical protein
VNAPEFEELAGEDVQALRDRLEPCRVRTRSDGRRVRGRGGGSPGLAGALRGRAAESERGRRGEPEDVARARQATVPAGSTCSMRVRFVSR